MQNESLANIIGIVMLNNLLSYGFIYIVVSRLLGHRTFPPKEDPTCHDT